MKIFGIDPGPELSAYALWDGHALLDKAIVPNGEFCSAMMRNLQSHGEFTVVLEMVACYGMAVGREIFETVFWIGRFYEISTSCSIMAERIYRRQVKIYFCNSQQATDANVRRVLLDRFGEKGTKKAPGLTYGLKDDLWSAFAIAVYAYDAKQAAQNRKN